MKSLIIASIFILGTIPLSVQNVSAQSSESGCYYNGQVYPVGTRIEGYICTSDGWKQQ